MNWRVSGSIAMGAMLFSAAPALQAFSQSSSWSSQRASLAPTQQVTVMAANVAVGPAVSGVVGLPSTAAELWPELSPLEVANRIRFGQDYVALSQAALARAAAAPAQIAVTPGVPAESSGGEIGSEVASLPEAEPSAPRSAGAVRVVGPKELAVGVNSPAGAERPMAPSASMPDGAAEPPMDSSAPSDIAVARPAVPNPPVVDAVEGPDANRSWDTPMVVGSVNPQLPFAPDQPQFTAPVPAPAHLRPAESYINKSSRIEQAVIAPPADIPNPGTQNRIVRYDRLEDYCRDPAYLRGEVEYGWCDDPGYFQRRDDLIMGADDYPQEWERPARPRRLERQQVEILGPSDIFPFLFGH